MYLLLYFCHALHFLENLLQSYIRTRWNNYNVMLLSGLVVNTVVSKFQVRLLGKTIRCVL